MPFEISAGGDGEGFRDRFDLLPAVAVALQKGYDLFVPVDEVFSLFAFGIGIARRIEEMVFRHLLQHEIGTLSGGGQKAFVVKVPGGFGVEFDQKPVVVGHLLKMRYQPSLVGRVAAKAPFDEVIHPAALHLLECVADHLSRLVIAVYGGDMEQGGEGRGVGELR